MTARRTKRDATRYLSAGAELSYAPGHAYRRDEGLPQYVIGCMLEGESVLRVRDVAYRRTAVSLSLLPPDTPYALHVPGPHRAIWFVFMPRPEWRAYLTWGFAAARPAAYPFVTVPQSEAGDRVLACLRRAVAEMKEPGGASVRLAELAFEEALIRIAGLAGVDGRDACMARVIDAMRADVARAWREGELARLAGLSVSGFAHRFRRATGASPMRFLEELRMALARDMLLSTDASVKEIAFAAGYADALHFSTRFRRLSGSSPRAFRNALPRK